MAEPVRSRALLAASERLDLLAVAPLPLRVKGQGTFQLGGGLYCAWLLSGLADLGHRVRAFATAPFPRGGREPGMSARPGLHVEWFALEYTPGQVPAPADHVRAQRARLEAALERTLADGRPDLVLLGSEVQAWYAVDACLERGLPTMLIAHGVPTAALLSGIYPPAATEALIGQLSKADLIVTVASHLEASLRTLGVERVRTIPTGIDTDAFRPRAKDTALLASLSVGADRFVVGSFSHLRAEKRIPDLIASAELVVEAEPRALYLIVGDGPCRDEAVALVAEKRLGEHFRFLGEIDHASVPAHLAATDIVVLASEREGYPLVCLEAHATARPLIVSDIPAGREVVKDGQTGLLFSVGDVSDLATKILTLARDPALRRTLGRNGRAAALAQTEERWLRACSEAIGETARAFEAR